MTNTTRLAAVMMAAAAVIGAASAIAAPSPAPGDAYVYRVINGYSKEVRGQIEYRVDKVDGERITVSVTRQNPQPGSAHTQVLTREGNWLRHPVVNHDQPVEYEFAPAYPAYVFPLEPRKSWSMRVNAVQTATGKRASVRVDGDVLGTERVSVPAGTFDTIKVKRWVYAGDAEGFRFETNIIETDWYAPQLGRAVKSESTSGYMQPDRCNELHACTPVRGDWNVLELIEVRAANPPH